MHTWLPDAHSEAPSPASAMLSAALLNTGMYAIIRFQALTRAPLGTHYAAQILLIFGFASVIVGALFIVLRGNFKRLFAYSSVEHMGIIAIALGLRRGARLLRRAAADAHARDRQGGPVPDQRRPRAALPHAADRRGRAAF